MGFDKTPTETFPGYTYASSVVGFAIADLPQLSAGEANATTGDVREILFGIIEQAYQAQQNLAAVDRSPRFTISRSSNHANDTGILTYTYTIAVKRNISGTGMQDEPA